MEQGIVSVSQVNDYLRLLTESDPFLSNIWIEGDVSNVYLSRAGHLYFTLGDGESTLKAVAFRSAALRVQPAISEGVRVTVGGRVTVYQKDATCQIYVEFADSSGMGIQALEIARLRGRLEAEGLFDPFRKRPIPEFPKVIGVVTSPTGAVIHDIQTVLRRRFPLAHLLVSPAQVQGSGAVESLLSGLDLLLQDGRADVIIIARGGGSAEDLADFNDERLARAVFAAGLPVVSAIGHETDFTILDDVADLRAPTPTAAAELITPDVADFALELIESRDRMTRSMGAIFQRNQSEHEQIVQRLDRVHPIRVVAQHRVLLEALHARLSSNLLGRIELERSRSLFDLVKLRSVGLRTLDRQRIDLGITQARLQSLAQLQLRTERSRQLDLRSRLRRGARSRIDQSGNNLNGLQYRLESLNPDAVLGRGFAVISNYNNQTVTSISQVRTGEGVRALVRDGTIAATVDGVSASYRQRDSND